MVVVLVAASGVVWWLRGPRSAPAEAAAQPIAAPKELVLAAQLRAHTALQVAVPVDGRVESASVAVGDEVFEGQLLAQIKSEGLESESQAAAQELERAQEKVNTLEASISSARLESSRAAADNERIRSELDRASKHYQREKMLLAEGATPRLQFEKAERDFKTLTAEAETIQAVAAQADERVSSLTRELDTARKLLQAKSDDVEGAKERVSAGEIISPVNGVVTGMRAKAGDTVDRSMRDFIVIATDLSTMEAVAEISSSQVQYVKQGQEAWVAVAESPDDLLPGTVKNVADGKVTVEFANPNPAIKPGITAQIRIKIT